MNTTTHDHPNPNAEHDAPVPVIHPADAAAAYARIEGELAGVDELLRVSVDIPKAVNTVLVAIPRAELIKPAIARELPLFDLASFDKLRDRALGCLYAHLVTLPGTNRNNPAQALIEEGLPLRQRLLDAAGALAKAGVFDEARVAQIRLGSGYVDAAADLIALAALFQDAWTALANRVWITAAEVERAAELGAILIGVLNGGSAVPAPAAERRVRAYTLFVGTYEDCRDAVAYVRRREGDVEDFLPSLFVRQRARPPAGAATPEPDPPADGGGGGGGVAPTNGNAPS